MRRKENLKPCLFEGLVNVEVIGMAREQGPPTAEFPSRKALGEGESFFLFILSLLLWLGAEVRLA